MRSSIFALVISLLLASPAPAQVTMMCINHKAAQMIELGLQVVDIPAAARMIAEDLCLYTAQELIDLSREDANVTASEAQEWGIEEMTKWAKQVLLKRMGLVN